MRRDAQHGGVGCAKQVSLIRAVSSPAMPPVRVSSWTINTRFVLRTVATIASSSSGASERRSITSTESPSSACNFSAASSALCTVAA